MRSVSRCPETGCSRILTARSGRVDPQDRRDRQPQSTYRSHLTAGENTPASGFPTSFVPVTPALLSSTRTRYRRSVDLRLRSIPPPDRFAAPQKVVTSRHTQHPITVRRSAAGDVRRQRPSDWVAIWFYHWLRNTLRDYRYAETHSSTGRIEQIEPVGLELSRMLRRPTVYCMTSSSSPQFSSLYDVAHTHAELILSLIHI